MSTDTLAPLILYAMWACVLLIFLFFARARSMAGGKRGVNSFKPVGDTEALDAFSRAHMNTVENLPVFAALYLCAIWVGSGAPIIELGWVILGARIAQSVVHLLSRSPNAVRARALMQAVQVICFLWLGGAAIATPSQPPL